MKVSEISDIVDSSWHYSWHWPNENGYLTLEGLLKARRDANGLLASLDRKSKDLKSAIMKLDIEISKYEQLRQGVLI